MRLWVDTDVGTNPDDAVALLCAAAHPDVELVGVSTVDDADGARAKLATQLLGNVPMTMGQHLDPQDFEECHPDAVLAIGPLTNIARLVEAGSALPRLAVMGGVIVPVEHRGTLRTVEHNFGSDPAAARSVLDRVPGALVCPLDVTVRMRLDADEISRLAALDDRLVTHFNEWGRAQSSMPVCLHDPLALLALLDEPVVRTKPRALVVEHDGRTRERNDGPRHEVVVSVDARNAKARIFDLIESGRR